MQLGTRITKWFKFNQGLNGMGIPGFEILCKISNVPFEIWHQILNPYTTNLHFTRC